MCSGRVGQRRTAAATAGGARSPASAVGRRHLQARLRGIEKARRSAAARSRPLEARGLPLGRRLRNGSRLDARSLPEHAAMETEAAQEGGRPLIDRGLFVPLSLDVTLLFTTRVYGVM